jgi:hypothetical protein
MNMARIRGAIHERHDFLGFRVEYDIAIRVTRRAACIFFI